MSKRIRLYGLVTIRQGDKVLVDKAFNHWVDAGLRGLMSALVGDHIVLTADATNIIYFWNQDWSIYLGSDTETPTTPGMTSLVSPIGTAPGTPPDTKSGTVHDGSADGDWYATYIATWNAGTVSGTVGELALYLRPFTSTSFGWVLSRSSTYYVPLAMVSRLSSADLDFSSFVINETVPLTVEWEVHFTFA